MHSATILNISMVSEVKKSRLDILLIGNISVALY